MSLQIRFYGLNKYNIGLNIDTTRWRRRPVISMVKEIVGHLEGSLNDVGGRSSYGDANGGVNMVKSQLVFRSHLTLD